jgi:hypothetical protein
MVVRYSVCIGASAVSVSEQEGSHTETGGGLWGEDARPVRESLRERGSEPEGFVLFDIAMKSEVGAG